MASVAEVSKIIEEFYDNPLNFIESKTHLDTLQKTLEALDSGSIRVCEKVESKWVTHQWVKKAILLYFKTRKVEPIEMGYGKVFDKFPLKKWKLEDNVRSVPGALVRFGSFVAKNTILMPSYVNAGAYVDEGSMIDTWATVGSCAQIGKGVHLSGGVGIGGVLEPPQAAPVIIEDHCFVGSRAILVEGVYVGESSVIGANVVITSSTPIIDVREKTEKVYKGFVPPRSVVIPGTRKKSFPAGDFYIPCAIIIGERSASTDTKVSLNSALRDFDVAV